MAVRKEGPGAVAHRIVGNVTGMVGLLIGQKRNFAAYMSAKCCSEAPCEKRVPRIQTGAQQSVIEKAVGPERPCWRTALIVASVPSHDVQLSSPLFAFPEEVRCSPSLARAMSIKRGLSASAPRSMCTIIGTVR